MNRASINCYRYTFGYTVLFQRQLSIATIINSIVIAENITKNNTNMTVVHILISTCKLIFMLSTSDLIMGLFCQNTQTTIFHRKSRLLMDKSLIISVFVYIYQSIQSPLLALIAISE